MTLEQIAVALDKAADLLEKDGWCQNAYAKTPDGFPAGVDEPGVLHCMTGAVMAVVTQIELISEIHTYLHNQLKSKGVRPYLTEWNDWPSRTKQEVVAFLHDSAKQAKIDVDITNG